MVWAENGSGLHVVAGTMRLQLCCAARRLKIATHWSERDELSSLCMLEAM